ncbi:golgi uridine diphosphate-N- acetylglucosamine transporter [Friedmanniomyces endolithicus]|nr:golgi uridine diphosphate-N- acetylglucosamine transporter [Friedmanniomyces endolithicus]
MEISLITPRSEPSSGLLITFFQFVFTTLASYPTQFSPGSPYGVTPPTVPLRRWAFIAVMFFSINMLNNWAFAFSISVPMHIILRSFSSVTTMIMGVLRGKRYSALQILSVVLLTLGVLVSAWADSEGKGKSMSLGNEASSSDFSTGLAILLLAQLLSAWMGAYVEDTYTMYKASWTENLFYSHIFSLPLFLPLSRSLREQYVKLAATPPLGLQEGSKQQSLGAVSVSGIFLGILGNTGESLPQGILFLLVNVVTQLACISGVNLLSSKSSAVTVTIILNIRKLVSFVISTLVFGHELSAKMVLGSALVFGSGALYGYETSWRLPAARRRKEVLTNGAKAVGSTEKRR